MLTAERMRRPVPLFVKSEAVETTPLRARVFPLTLTAGRPKVPLRVMTLEVETVSEPVPLIGAANVMSRLWFRFRTAPVPSVMRPELLMTGAVSVVLSPRVMLVEASEPLPVMVAVPAWRAKAPVVLSVAVLRLPADCVTLVAVRLPVSVVAPALVKAPEATKLVAVKVPVPKAMAAALIAPAEASVPAAVRLPPAVSEPTVREPLERTAPVTVSALPAWVVKMPFAPMVREAAETAGAFSKLPSTEAAPKESAVAPAVFKVAPSAIVVAVATDKAFVAAKVPAVTVKFVKPTEPVRVEVPTLSLRRSPEPPTLLTIAPSTFWTTSSVPVSKVSEPVPSAPPSTSLTPPPVTFVPPV